MVLTVNTSLNNFRLMPAIFGAKTNMARRARGEGAFLPTDYAKLAALKPTDIRRTLGVSNNRLPVGPRLSFPINQWVLRRRAR
jgi:hypothetical protein